MAPAMQSNKFFDARGEHAYGWALAKTKSKHKYIEQSGRDPGFSIAHCGVSGGSVDRDRARQSGGRSRQPDGG